MMVGKNMSSAGFKGKLTPTGQIVVPPDIAAQVPAGEQIQVVLQWGAPNDDADWRAAGRRQFEDAYSPEDSVYESLIHDASRG
jgi:hypothetical protein